ncbi:MAG: hypothetical protein JWM55_798 [Acidimicrobiaceae bacterium]|nr:hypothetical protein [Acidimicrobiaceae bacterium]
MDSRRESDESFAPGEFEEERYRVLSREIPHKGGVTYGFLLWSQSLVLDR